MSAGGDGGREVVGGDGGREVEPTLPRNKSSAVSTLTSALQSGGHITTSRQEQQVEESKDSSNPTTSNNTGSGGFPKICKYSLLPPGTYRIRISNFKLVWGMNEEAPRKISLLFPAPFEAVAGERFVSVTPNAQIEAEAAAQQGGDDFVLSSVGSLGTGSGSGGGMGLTAGDLSYVTPTRNGATTVADSATGPGSLPSSHSAMMMVRHGEGAPHSAPRAGGDRPPPLPHDDSLTIQGAKSTRQYSSASSTTYGQQQHHEVTWDRVYNASRTGTSALLTTVPNHNHRRNITTTIASAPIPIQQSSNGHSSRSLISSSSQQQTSPSTIEPLVLTWRGAEPLDKLHVSLKVTMPAFSFNSGGGSSSRPTSTSKKSSRSTQSLSKAMSRSLGASSGNAAASEIVGAAAAGVDASACSHTTAALATTPTSSSRQQSSSSSARNSRNSSSTGNGGGGGGGGVNEEAVMMLSSMGYTTEQTTAALLATDNSIERAADWLFSHADDLDAAVAEVTTSNRLSSATSTGAGAAAVSPVDDGEGKYTLMAIISHIGKSTESGHYVCHIKNKLGQWVLYNDEKVGKCSKAPLDYGFMYLYKRDDGPGTFSS
mmetsp:Transcript_838/g.1283  ORF Transcript_838/g.1283 Transcript_838/m.1283 type:complete len:599 (+) Transcript_838:963-2759(+)